MNRLDHIQKAQAALGQVIAHLQAIDEHEGVAATWSLRLETKLYDLESAEPCGDPDPYETAKEEAHNG